MPWRYCFEGFKQYQLLVSVSLFVYNMKKKKNRWDDHYTRQAKKEKYPARSVYKLKEIQQKHRLIKPGDKVLDLGCAPGSWLLFAAELTGKDGQIAGIDLKPVTGPLPPHVRVITGDVLSPDKDMVDALGRDFNVILSDMAPATTGIKRVDAARSFNLCEAALNVAKACLKQGGAFVCKIFQGEDFNTFLDMIGEVFQTCKIYKPRSSRKASREIYIIGIGRK